MSVPLPSLRISFGNTSIFHYILLHFIVLFCCCFILFFKLSLWQLCLEQVYWCHFSNSICLLFLSASHFGNSWNISNFFMIIMLWWSVNSDLSTLQYSGKIYVLWNQKICVTCDIHFIAMVLNWTTNISKVYLINLVKSRLYNWAGPYGASLG